MSQFALSIDALLARDINIQWFEGVALVQGVCRQLTTRSGSTGFPPASQILLSQDGSVTIIGSDWTGSAVEGAARLLADLRTSDMPVQLRLLMTQASGDDGSYPTLSDFSAALAYFERSDAQTILRQLAARASLAGTRHDAASVPTGAAPVEKVMEKKKARDPEKSPETKKSQNQHAVVAVLVVAVIVAVGAFMVFGPGRARLGAAGTTVMKQLGLGTPGTVPPDASSEPVEAGGSAAKVTGKTAPSAPRSASQASATSGLKPGAPAAATVRAPMASSPAARPAVQNPITLTVPGDGGAAVTYVISASPAGSAAASPPALLAEAALPEDRIYSPRDSNVVPPRQVYPTFPEPPADVEQRIRTVVDVVVSGDGLVERVHLRNQPRDILEFMLLSAAKAWRFEPAHLDGRPVRFIHSLTIIRQ